MKFLRFQGNAELQVNQKKKIKSNLNDLSETKLLR